MNVRFVVTETTTIDDVLAEGEPMPEAREGSHLTQAILFYKMNS
jgi:hypothetical protein